ncbi:MAG: stage 0 sporulation protein, partial [Nitrospirae bacterium]|nr:stage 0 sporulation protein [Nitrospirota bacterium]
MPEVVGIRFKKCGKIYDFEIDDINENRPAFGNLVVIESNFGVTIGTVVVEAHTIENPERELKKILRLATDEDLKQQQDNELVRVDARSYCIERVMARALQMKLIDIEVTLDKKRILFYFTANGRIDFRELVKDLASRFKTRIEMRQIGVRDEAKLIGGLGICGREACCRTFLSDFAPISIKMARNQEIALNPGKLSGLCGRLMCCIGFETLESCCAEQLKEEDFIIINEQDAQLEPIEVSTPLIDSVGKLP